MRKLFFTLFILFYNIISSQNTIEVIYKTSFNGSFLDKNNKEHNQLTGFNNGIENKISTLQFQLLINNQKSCFKSIPQMEKEGETTGEKMAKIVVGFENIYNVDLTSKKIIEDELFTDKRFKVDLGFDTYIWSFENEQKDINGYKCYLAKTKYGNLDVFAWYCPILPYSFGPLEFCNLPGLILELQKGNIIYQAEKIILNSKNKFEFDLSKFITISKEERLEYLEKQKEFFKNKFKD